MIGSILKQKREEKRISQQDIADLLGISQRTYSNIESDKSNPTLEQILKIDKFLKVDLLKELNKRGFAFYQNNNNKGTNSGGIVNNNYPKELKEQHEIQTAHLKEEIIFLKEQLSSKEEQHQNQITHLKEEITFLRE